MYRVLIVEDSRLARLELRTQLAEVMPISAMYEASCLNEARVILSEEEIDVLFLDIDLPDGNGFELLYELTSAPHVVFTTAYNQYAVDAFERDAVDYLLKPFSVDRLKKACARLPQCVNNKETILSIEQKIFVKDGTRCWFVPLANIEKFSAQGNYTQVHFEQSRPMLSKTLANIELRLPKEAFFRANRSEIVQLSHIIATEFCSSGALVLTLHSGDKVEVSRRQLSKFRQLFSL
ncbi:TPA: response regulator [Vibrio vulnificus]|nr:response regulator [Vibrio vulnificus]HDY7568188.1 response regulator transcription factor [Vibrio vulnificus]